MSSISIEKSGKRQRVKQQPVVVYADELDFNKNCFLNTVYSNKQKGFRSVKVTASQDNPNPVHIQFSNVSGRIPQKFGIDTNQHGKTYLTFSIPCEKEYEALLKFQNDAKEYAKQHKSEWWTYPVNDNQIEDNFASIVSTRKEKIDSEGLWPGNMKVHIPLDDDGDVKNCEVLDEEGNKMSIHELPGRKWSDVMIELSGIYFQNRFNWGFGPKTLRLIKVAHDESGSYAASNLSYLDILLSKKDSEDGSDIVEPGQKRKRDDCDVPVKDI